MQNSDALVWYGTVLNLALGALILIPYLRRRSDLLTTWNIFLLGMIMCTGIGCYEVKWGDWSWPMLQWFQPTKQEVQWYMLASTAFTVALILGYYYNPLGFAFGRRIFRRWPVATTPMMTFVIVSCIVLASLSMVSGRIFFVGLVAAQMSHKAATFAVVFSFLLWNRNRKNIFWLAVVLAVFLWAGLFTMLVSPGRRLLLSVFLVPVICLYWLQVRYWRPSRSLFALAGAAVLILVVSSAYSSIRWFSVGRNAEERTLKNIVKQVQTIRERNLFGELLSNKLHYFSQWSTHYSLLAERFVNTGDLEPVPLNTLRFMLTYPIPRSIYPEKPEIIGITMVRDIVGYGTTNWGIGIAGHGAYEGGVPALVLYALLIAFGLRVVDEAMSSQPANPFLLAALVSAAPHILSIPRGDFGVMFAETLEAYAFAFALAIVCRFLFGTAQAGAPNMPPWTLANVHPSLSHFPPGQGQLR